VTGFISKERLTHTETFVLSLQGIQTWWFHGHEKIIIAFLGWCALQCCGWISAIQKIVLPPSSWLKFISITNLHGATNQKTTNYKGRETNKTFYSASHFLSVVFTGILIKFKSKMNDVTLKVQTHYWYNNSTVLTDCFRNEVSVVNVGIDPSLFRQRK